jgi:hypothetical protein
VFSKSTLALFEARVFFVDDINAALPADDLAIRGTAFNGSANFHIFSLEKGSRAADFRGRQSPRAIKRKGVILSKRKGVASVL